MDWVIVTRDLVIPILREFGFPVVVALGALALCGAMAWQMHKFVTGKLVTVIERSSGALEKSSAAEKAVAHELERLSDRIEHCPDRAAAEFDRRPTPAHMGATS